MKKIRNYFLLLTVCVGSVYCEETIYNLPTFTVYGQEVANLRPATTYESLVSNLDFNPRIDFQTRNMAEAQGDINIRGGIFESTGIKIGAATLIDPQTGHYSTELPIAPEMLGNPEVLTGADNAYGSFNSTAGTLSYGWAEISPSSMLTLGAGSNNLKFLRIHEATSSPLADKEGWVIGYETEYSRSESDGTVEFGDHDFNRVTGRVQLLGPNSQTDFFAGYQEKFFGLFGMYTGDQYVAYDPYETEKIRTSLFIINHEQNYGDDNKWEATAYYRDNGDHYQFNRFKPDNRFNHNTKILALTVGGKHNLNSSFALNYNIQLTEDKIESTSLENGKFTDRRYTKVGLLPEYTYNVDDNTRVVVKAGATYDSTNRDDSEILPVAELALIKGNDKLYISYAETTQVVGYGAIGGSEDSGLFRSKHDLLREVSENVEIGYSINRGQWSLDSAIFYRWDNNLVDWTYTGNGARAAENVNIETFGVEFIASKQWKYIEAVASYSRLEKSEEYNNPDVIGSFYAMNYPKHRITLGAIYTPNAHFEIRVDNEWRVHEENTLRSGPDKALFSNIGISYYPRPTRELEVFLAYDKPWDEDFQEIPGTISRGDQFSLGLTHKF